MTKKENLAPFKDYLLGLGVELKKHKICLSEKEESEQLMLLYAYYKYFNANSVDIPELLAGDCYGKGRTIGIYVDIDSDNDDIDIILPICCQDKEIFFRGIEKDVEQIVDSIYDDVRRPRKVEKFLEEKEINIKSQKVKVKIKIITNVNLSNKIRNDLRYKLSTLPNEHEVEHEIVIGREILDTIINIEDPKQFVDEGEIEIDNKNNYLVFGKEHSIIVNLSAKSLQELYLKCFTKGLFSQNLRCYIKAPRIDSDIVQSIQNNNDIFWYLNNGIIIICDDYKLTNNKIKLKKFSIINGGQTTYLIGNTDFEKDFYLQCKIVKNAKTKDDEKLDFIAAVAKASNSQKPIKDNDLIANRTEQRMLQKQLDEIGIFCRIKRGEKPNKLKFKENWQDTNNEELAQYLASFMYLMPGTARNSKTKLFKPKNYNLIFGSDKKYNSLLIKDLLKIKCAYKTYDNKVSKSDYPEDEHKIKLVKYGTHLTVALIGVISKLYYNEYYKHKVLNYSTLEDQHNYLAQFDISHPIFRSDVEGKELYSLFELLYSKFYLKGYVDYRKGMTNNDYSNFSKQDSNFVRWIMKYILNDIKSGEIKNIFANFAEIAYKPSQNDLNNNEHLVYKYRNTNNTKAIKKQDELYAELRVITDNSRK